MTCALNHLGADLQSPHTHNVKQSARALATVIRATTAVAESEAYAWRSGAGSCKKEV